jgi:hypothetical protein
MKKIELKIKNKDGKFMPDLCRIDLSKDKDDDSRLSFFLSHFNKWVIMGEGFKNGYTDDECLCAILLLQGVMCQYPQYFSDKDLDTTVEKHNNTMSGKNIAKVTVFQQESPPVLTVG